MEIGDNIICVDNLNEDLSLTINNSYKIVNFTKYFIYIKDDNGFVNGYYLKRFKPIHKIREDKINLLLE